LLIYEGLNIDIVYCRKSNVEDVAVNGSNGSKGAMEENGVEDTC